MISRCPSCAAQVDDDAPQCPSCYWDFKARRRLPPAGAKPYVEPPAASASKREGAPATQDEVPPGLGGLKMVPFSESLAETRVPKAKTETPKGADSGFGSGLLQFPKLDKGDVKKTDDKDPFALPTPRPAKLPAFGKDAPKPPAEKDEKAGYSLPPLKPAEKSDLPVEKNDPFEPAIPAVKVPAQNKPKPESDLLKDLPRERAEGEKVKAAPPAEDEPPKTIVRAVKPAKAREEVPAKAESKPKREIKKPDETSFPVPPKPARSPLVWVGAAVGLVVLGAAGAFFLTPRRDAAVGVKPAAATGAIFAPGSASVKLEPGQVAALNAPPPAAAAAAPVPAPAPVVLPAPAPVVPPARVAAAPVPAPAPAPAAPQTAAAVAAPAAAPRRVVVVLLKQPALPLEPEPSVKAKSEAAVQTWTFEGRVYDIIGLNSVANAKLALIDASGKVAGEAVTSADGRYSISADALPKGGYKLTLSHPDYTGRYLEEIDPPWEQAPREDRVAAAKGLDKRPWIGQAGKTTARDIVAVPKAADSE